MDSLNDSNLHYVSISAIPVVSTNPRDVTVIVGHQAEFSCSYDISKQPFPKLTKWRITDNNGNVKIAMETSHVGATSMYSISFIYSFDAGKYECFGENEFGTSTSLPATLTVQCKDALTCSECVILNYNFVFSDIGDITLAVKPSTTVHDKTQVTIECTVDYQQPRFN